MFWVDATFKALDLGMNISELPECAVWKAFWTAEEQGNATTQFKLVKVDII